MRMDFSGQPTLSALLHRAGLKLVDVGGRGSALKSLLPLAPYAHYFVSEPDAQEASRLAEALPEDERWHAITVFNEAVALRHGEATLHVTQHPGMSSLLEPDPDVTAPFVNFRKYAVDRVETVRTVPLDDAAARHGFEDACFLKLDTQGTELDIMRSGARLMAGPVLAVYVETNFRPFYKGQSVFADLDAYLRGQGLSLFLLNRTGLRRARYRKEFYSRRVITWAHCLYLREPASLLRGEHAARDLTRLLGLALAFQYFDLAWEIVAACRTAGVLPEPEQDALERELENLSRRVSQRVLRDAAKELADADLKELLHSANLRDKDRLERS